MRLNVNVNIPEFNKEMDRAVEGIEKSIEKAHREIGLTMQRKAQDMAMGRRGRKFKAHKTGNFAQSIDSKVVITGSGIKTELHDGVKYGIIIEQGSKPHVIRARKKKLLMFPTEKKYVPSEILERLKDGKPIIINRKDGSVIGWLKKRGKLFCLTDEVNHPGTEGKKIFETTLNEMKDEVQDIMSSHIK